MEKKNSQITPKSMQNRKTKRHPVDTFFGKFFHVIVEAFKTFVAARGTESSASIAYYTLFSLFPLLLTFVAVGSFFLEQDYVKQELIKFIPTIIPVSQDFIISNIEQVFQARGTVSILAFLGLVWSSTAVFSTIIRNINLAWPDAAPSSFIKMKLLSLAIIFLMALLLIISSFTLTLRNLAADFGFTLDLAFIGQFFTSFFFTKIFPNLVRIFIFFGLYFWVPQIKVKKMAAITGAVVTASIWQLLNIVFGSYVSSGMASYEVVYGSLGKIVALLAWTYFSSYIILFGAHLSSSIDRNIK